MVRYPLEPVREGEICELEELRAEAKRLRAQIRSFDRQLETIKLEYPYSMRVYLEDNEKGREREAELSAQLRDLRQRTARYESAIENMLHPSDEEEETT